MTQDDKESDDEEFTFREMKDLRDKRRENLLRRMQQHHEEEGLDESVDLDESYESVSNSYKQLYEDNKPSSTTLPGMKNSYSNPP